MQKSSVQVTVHFKTWNSQTQGTKWKKGERKFNNNKFNFYSSSDEELFNILQMCIAAEHMLKNSLCAKATAYFADHFCSHFNASGYTNCSKSWIQLGSNNVHLLFLFLKSEKLF